MAGGKFPANPIVEKIGDAPAVKLMGYFGATSGGFIRIHPSLDDLSTYCEVREDDILHAEDAPADLLPYGGSAIWVKADASVRWGTSTLTEARFIAGVISAQMAGGKAARTARAQAPVEPDTANCVGFSVWPCSVAWGACLPSGDDPCVNTKQWGCAIVSANTCLTTCAGYTCVAECYSVGCPPHHTQFCTKGRITQCCEIATAVCPK